MSVRIREITVVDGFNKPKILRAVLAADPDRPCDASDSIAPTGRSQRRLRHRLRSLRTRSGILSAYATAVLQGHFYTHGGHDL